MAGVPNASDGPCIPPMCIPNNMRMATRKHRPPLNNTMDGFPSANDTGGWKVRRDKSLADAVCGVCDVQCVVSAVSLVFTVGVIANLLVIILVIKDKTLHKPTFIAIAGLALADMMFLAINLVISVEVLLVVFICVEKFTGTINVAGVVSIFWKNATFNVVLIAVVRYITLAHPFKARNHLTNKRILVSIIAIMVLVAIYNGCFRVADTMTRTTKTYRQTRTIVDWFASYILPLCVTAVLHILKVIAVRRSLNKTRTCAAVSDSSSKGKANNVIGDMTSAIAFVLAAALLLPLPKFIVFIVRSGGIMKYKTHMVVTGIVDLLYFVTFAINPFIYAFKSPLFQTSMRSQFFRRR